MKNISYSLSVVLLGFLFALTVLLPHILQRMDDAYPFQGIAIMATDAESHYAARYHEILDGHPELGNTYFSAPKDQPSIQPPLPEWSLAMASRILPFDPIVSFVLLTGLCALLVFCAAVLATFAITGKRYESLAAVTVMLFAAAAFGTPWNLMHALSSGSLADFGWLRFARPVNPLWTSTWFFLTVFFLSKWVRKAEMLWMIVAACTTSILLYSYFYGWTYLLATCGVLFLWYASRKDTKRLAHLLAFLLIFVVLGIPYFLHLSALMHHEWYPDASMRYGLIPSRAPVLGVWVIVLIFLSLFARRIAWKEQFPLVLSLACGGCIAMNQNMITGSSLFPEHYHWYFIQPLGTLFLSFTLILVCEQYMRVRLYRCVLLMTMIVSLAFGFVEQRDTYEVYRQDWGNAQHLASLFRYAREHLPPDSVAYSFDPFLTELLPVYTAMNVYTSTQAGNYLVPTARMRDVWFFTFWLQGITPQSARVQFPTTLRKTLGSGIYGSHFRRLRGDYAAVPEEIVLQLVKEYESYYALSFREKTSRYPLDYFITSTTDVQTKELRMLLSGGKNLFSDSGYRIIALRK
ncbi:hypothetical protein EXS65_01910 [Candidatus Peribacteria bacterium]|nr:hypothetical protein [Candidatus Peribacteria bacterium]